MTNEHKYTAQEMRDRAESYGRHHPNSEIPDMLRQAADAEEELEHNHEEWVRLVAENARLAARLEAVVKKCAQSKWMWRDTNEQSVSAKIQHNSAIDAILRAASGEGDAE